MPPALQHYPAPEWLSFGSHDDAIVLAPRARIIFAPVQLEAGELQFIEGDEQVFRPLVAIATFSDAMIDKEVVKNCRANHSVFSTEFAYGGVSALCQKCCLLQINFWRKWCEVVCKRFGICSIIMWFLVC